MTAVSSGCCSDSRSLWIAEERLQEESRQRTHVSTDQLR
jgi:hypothetical protein